MTIKAIVFDLGGVIVELDFSQFFKNVIEISPLNKPDSFLLLEFWRQSDVYHQGKIANEEFYRQACELLEINSLTQEDFFNSFNSVISSYRTEVVELIRILKKKNIYKLLILSNINYSHWHYILERDITFRRLFDDIILSFEVHLTKPDPRIFQIVIERCECKPEEILYIDDGLNNVRSARELGINAIYFTSIQNLIEEFEKLKILS